MNFFDLIEFNQSPTARRLPLGIEGRAVGISSSLEQEFMSY
jgi:hypothetical protein